MNYWRMRMRKGNHGQDMFRQCVLLELAAIYYKPVEDVNLTEFSAEKLPAVWTELESSQKGSLAKFAWRIRGGDVIYVAESYPSRIVAVGRVPGTPQAAAYRYLADTPIIDDEGHPWRHTIMVEWEQLFSPIAYPKPWATQATVLDLPSEEVNKIKSLLKSERKASLSSSTQADDPYAANNEVDEEIQRQLVESSGYTRYSKEAIRVIEQKHTKLCNTFVGWLEQTWKITCKVERKHIDVTFQLDGQSILVEFKLAYNSDPKPAIREALGQIGECNLYPDREFHDHWLLMLDCAPTENDRIFLKRIREMNLPLSYGWLEDREFSFSTDCPLFNKTHQAPKARHITA